MKQSCLMLGVGHGKPIRRLKCPTSVPESDTDWLTLDNNPAAEPDFLFDLEDLERGYKIPCPDEHFDEIHAYEVLEHFGRQGDYRGLFNTFKEFWRVLKPKGMLIGTCPDLKSPWLWGDPGHTRVISQGVLSFLRREHYEQLGRTVSSDYRAFINPCWWEILYARVAEDSFIFCLNKVS